MKKLLALVFGLTFSAFGTTAFAEVSSEALAEVIHTAEDTTHEELLEGKIDYGASMSETDLLCDDIDFSKMYRRYPLLYNETYLKRISGSGLLELLHDEPMESYFGYGVDDNRLYRLHFADLGHAVDDETIAANPEEYGKYSQCYAVSGEHNYNLADYAEVLAEVGVSDVYDAYFATVYVYTRGDDYCYVAYFDTDNGEYVINIAKDRTKISKQSDEELEYLVPYTLDEFFEKMDVALSDTMEYHSGKSGTYIDDKGDDSEKKDEKEAWDIDEFIDISLKNHSISDTFDTSLLHQDEDGNYLAISVPDSEEYDTVIDLSKVLKAYHIAVDEKAAVMDYDGSGLAEYFADYYGDEELQAYRYIMTDEDGERYHLLISADEYNYTDIGNSAEAWEDGISDALAVVNDSGISDIYDAYSIDWHTKIKYDDNSQRGIRYSGIYLDTDEGEFVVFYDNTAGAVISRDVTKAEMLTLYPVREFLDIVAGNYDEAGVVVRDVEVADKDGDSEKTTIVQNPEQSEDKDNEEEKDSEKPEKTEIDVTLYGKNLVFPDQKPIIENNRVLVPFRVIFEALEADVLWDGDTRTVTATKGDITITLTIGDNKIIKNGEVIEVDVPAQIKNERTLVPIRVVSESFENTVSWDGENKIVGIK